MTAEARPVGPSPEQIELVEQEKAIVPMAACVTVRVWELPVRVLHWTVVAATLVLSVTGWYIGRPYIVVRTDPSFLMGTMRAVHLAAAWVFSVAILCRVIWAFIGNRWARWDQFIPVRQSRRKWVVGTIKYYLFLRKEPPPAAGHNPLAGLTYTVVFVMFCYQIVTGLALAGLANPGNWLSALTGWIFDLASIQTIRLTHHMVMWLTVGFVIHHVYSATLVDIEEKSGLLSSIVTGYKRLPPDRL